MENKISKGVQVRILGEIKEDEFDIEHRFSGYGLSKISQPHEWKLICKFYHNTLIKHQELISIFLAYCKEFYPHYHFSIPNNTLGAIFVEANLCDMLFTQFYEHNIDVNLDKPFSFGEIVTEFMIRYLGYSLIGFSEQKIILTSQSNCDKRFVTYLEKDFYTIYRLARVGYWDGSFSKLPVLPTRDSYLKFEEYIEDEKGQKHLVLK